MSFSDKYVSKFSEGWNKWNGLEIKNQIIDGLEALLNNCLTNNKKKNYNLINNYCSFTKKHKNLKKSKLYKKYC